MVLARCGNSKQRADQRRQNVHGQAMSNLNSSRAVREDSPEPAFVSNIATKYRTGQAHELLPAEPGHRAGHGPQRGDTQHVLFEFNIRRLLVIATASPAKIYSISANIRSPRMRGMMRQWLDQPEGTCLGRHQIPFLIDSRRA